MPYVKQNPYSTGLLSEDPHKTTLLNKYTSEGMRQYYVECYVNQKSLLKSLFQDKIFPYIKLI